ncbi:proton channel OtopLc-like isoform X1 [Pecten maximus]|uniref:proton channel OtopLc-like isoform X1 n=1 Tax=Pecten maximus TaxID=6579 RepID=UPI001458344D|nr:proton channel OtopLc-like isoform X1 [Pecten maximus]XP_033743720.1 proton channel OtopLc-like isoform X1 [Pecten maximus]XP_033743722.1 proton channel OtopLc-like isoform X1 [Pecten maximus]
MRRSGVYIVNEPAEDPPSAENGGPDHVYLNKMSEEGENGMGEEMMNDTVGLPVEASTPTPKKSKRIRLPSVYRSSLVKLLCGLYALIIVVLGIVFSTATSLTARERHHQFYLEVFLVYLYVFSLGLLIYFQLGLLSGVKVKNNYYEPNIRISVRNDGSIHKSPTASPYPTRAADAGANRSEEVQPLDQSKAEQVSVGSFHSHMELPSPGGVAHAGEGINFYLRLGALAFACGSVILDGFHIATYFETQMTEECKSPIFIFVYVMHLLFTFVQTFFLFKNHKLVIDKAKPLVRFGMMHLMATNLCVVIVTAITETAEDYRQDYFNNLLKYQELNNITPKDNITGSCYRQETLARSASPYLFPSLIIYSIIAAGIIYRLYQYIGVRIKQRWPSHTSLTSSVPAGAAAIDCEKANKGLFLGLLVAVLTLIAMAIFFVFDTRVESPDNAIKVFFTTEIILMVITSVGIVWGYMRLSILKFLKTIFFSVDSVLLLVALSGSYIYLCFTLISVFSFCSEMGTDTIKGILSLVTIALAICQITLQTVFILDGLCRCAENDEQMMAKPGRAVVTFLLICNLAMWIVSMFEMKKTKVVEMHENFYGILAWNIINHLCVPLLIFFRFHSAICLSKIWYNAYQKEKIP